MNVWVKTLILVGCGLLVAACDNAPERTVTELPPSVDLVAAVTQQGTGKPVNADGVSQWLAGQETAPLAGFVKQDERGTLLVLFAALADFAVELRTADQGRGGVVPYDEVSASEATAVVIGSSFVSELHGLTPVGLLQRNGEILSPIQRHGYTRVFGISDDGVGVVDHLAYQRDLFHAALQAGPGVIEEGQLDISERDLERTPYFRTLVGSCGDHVLFTATLAPMHLYHVGQMLLEAAEARGHVCDEVVNLAGDREAVLVLRGVGDSQAGESILNVGDPRTHKVAVLALVPRASSAGSAN